MIPITSHLAKLETTGLIRLFQTEPELAYLFRHILVQDAAYESLLYQDRKQLHKIAAETLIRLYPDRLDALAATLAQHFQMAEDDPQALKYFILAGDVAYKQYALSEAIAHYSQALEIAQTNGTESEAPALEHLYSRRGRALEFQAQHQQALDNYIEMEALGDNLNIQTLRLRGIIEQARLRVIPALLYDSKQGQILIDRALPLALHLKDRPAEARVYWILSLLNLNIGEYDLALMYGEKSLILARELNITEQLAYTLHDLSRPYQILGRIDEARLALDESRQLWRQLVNLPMLVDNLATIANLALEQCKFTEALEFAKEAFEIGHSINNFWGVSHASIMMSIVYFSIGHIDQALEITQKTIGISKKAGVPIISVMARFRLAWYYLILGDISRAYQIIEMLKSEEKEYFVKTKGLLEYLATSIRFDVRAKRLESAEANLEKALQVNSKTSLDLSNTYLLLMAQCELALAQGKFDQALALVNHLNSSYQLSSQRAIVFGLHLKSKILFASRDLEAAAQTLNDFLQRPTVVNFRDILWPTLLILSKVEAQRGNQEKSLIYHHQAQEVIDYIAAHISEPELRATFLNYAHDGGER